MKYKNIITLQQSNMQGLGAMAVWAIYGGGCGFARIPVTIII